jgi:hypothetical protein
MSIMVSNEERSAGEEVTCVTAEVTGKRTDPGKSLITINERARMPGKQTSRRI